MSLDSAEDNANIQEREDINLPVDMAGFLEQFVENEKNCDLAPDDIRKKIHYLMQNAERFEEEVAYFEMPFIAFGEQAEIKLKEAANGMGDPFKKMLLSHYEELRKKTEKIIGNIRKKGVAYLVDKKGDYNEEVAVAIEKLFHEMMKGFRHLSTEILDTLNPEYAETSIGTSFERGKSLSEYLEAIPERQKPRRLNGDSAEYEMEQQRITEIIEILGKEGDVSSDEIRKKLFALTKNMLSHMADDLAVNAAVLLEKRANGGSYRNLMVLKERPLAQLDFLLDVVIRSVRVVKNTRIQTEMLVGDQKSDVLEQSPEIPSAEEAPLRFTG